MDQIQIDRIGASIAAANCEHKLLNTQYELEAAKQRELGLLAVIEFMRNGLDEYWAKNNPIPEPSQALREHDSEYAEEISTRLDDLGYGWTGAVLEVRRMAEERRRNNVSHSAIHF